MPNGLAVGSRTSRCKDIADALRSSAGRNPGGSNLQWVGPPAVDLTTSGYGHIAPKTSAGMVVTMLYACVGIPLTLLTITNLGRMLATAFRFLYLNIFSIVCCCHRRTRTPETLPLHVTASTSAADRDLHQLDHNSADCGPEMTQADTGDERGGNSNKPEADVVVRWRHSSDQPSRLCPLQLVTDMDEIQKVSVPLSVSFAVLVGYIAVGALLFSLCEDWEYLVASYFCFVTLSTIGFGDYVPGTSLDASASQEKMVLCALYLVFGLALLAMCFDLMQEETKNKFRTLGRRLGLVEGAE